MWDVDGGEGVVIFVLDVVGGVVRVLVGVVVVIVVVVAFVVDSIPRYNWPQCGPDVD